ncbi:BatA domain-containing protein [Microbulbifer sp. Q7]|uniref:BatA domain-containing protein n=1 Tax=Microbulbifer sp. Q7 TaxID=1785091 RepID=UPI00083220B9|nr:BatA domain-containing protein [Microbulbifer sp. Q7]
MPWPPALLMESPAWLWLASALAIPLLVHLLRRSQPREITFAAVRWLQQKPARRWNKWILRDRWLLLLRLLLILLLALLLVQPLLLRKAPPSDNTLLVDPAVPPQALAQFLAQHPQLIDRFWLHPNPEPLHQAPSPSVALWPALSQLAHNPRFRHAHILLNQAENPDGHRALRVSPHWQWHAVETSGAKADPTLPKIVQLGAEPAWLAPAMGQLQEGPLPGLTLQQRPASALTALEDADWVIYAVPGALPEPLRVFVRDGGMLVTDARVTAEDTLGFSEVDGGSDFIESGLADSGYSDSGLEAVAIGRGSWLRYRGDWQSESFFHNNALPQQLWAHWSAQDWPWLHRSRGHWTVTQPPGVPVEDAAVSREFSQPLHYPLLLAFALLLLLERAVALSRPTLLHKGGARD